MALTTEDLKSIKDIFDARFDQVDARLDKIDEKLHEVDERFNAVDSTMTSMKTDIQKLQDDAPGYIENVKVVTAPCPDPVYELHPQNKSRIGADVAAASLDFSRGE